MKKHRYNGRSNYFNKNLKSKNDYDLFVEKCYYDISTQWAKQFSDLPKLYFLNYAICQKRNRQGMNKQQYKKFISHFYFDKQFNDIYKAWLLTDRKDKYLKPSLDHIQPLSKGGHANNIDNIQFLSWLENLCKNNTSQKQWNKVKENIDKYFC